jgi:N-acyl-D-amino-acid deacylase
MLDRLKNEETRSRMALDMIHRGRGADWGWGNVLITSIKTQKNKHYEGLSLLEIAQRRGLAVLDTLFDIILEEENAASMVGFSMSEENVRTIMQSSFQMVCTDGILLGKPHPRAFGSFPRVLGRYVKQGVLRLEEAIRKMTLLPSQTFHLYDRGVLKPGMWADITIFDPSTIIDKGTYINPIQYPEGVKYVMVNGDVTVDEGKQTGRRAGNVLRHKSRWYPKEGSKRLRKLG